MRKLIAAGALGLLITTLPALASADVLDEIGGGGNSSTRSFQREQRRFTGGDDWIRAEATEQVNWTGLLDRLFTLLTSDEYLGAKYPEVKKAAELARSMGDFSLAGTMEKCSIDGEDMRMQFGSYYKDLDPASLRGRTFGLADEKLVSAEYMPAEGALLYFGMNHLIERAEITADAIKIAQESAGEDALDINELLNELGAGDLGMILGLAGATGADQMAKDMLSGEAAFALFNLPPLNKLDSDLKPADFGAALMLGLADSSKLDSMIAGFGSNAGLVALDTAGGDWKGYSIPGADGVALVYNSEIAIVVTNPAVIETIKAAHGNGGMEVGACQYYLDINMEMMHQQVLSPACELIIGEAGKQLEDGQTLFVPSKETAFVLALPEPSALGRISASGHHDSGYVAELNMKTAVMTYMIYYMGLGGCLLAQTEDWH